MTRLADELILQGIATGDVEEAMPSASINRPIIVPFPEAA